MALEKILRELCASFEQMQKPLNELVNLTGDFGPQKGTVHFVPSFYDHIIEVDALCAEASEAAGEAVKSVDRQLDLLATRKALTDCHEDFNKLLKKFWLDVMSFGQIEELAALGKEHGTKSSEQWSKWAGTVREWIEDCMVCLLRVNEVLCLCWQEIAERVGATSLSVRATNVGQQITMPNAEENVPEGIT